MSKFPLGSVLFALCLTLPLRGAQDFSPAYNFTVLAGVNAAGSADGSATTARFNAPSDTAVDAAGNVYVADRGNHTIRKITPAGVVSTLAGMAGESGGANGSGTSARFTGPDGLAIDSAGNLYASDMQAIRKITPAGQVSNFLELPVRGLTVDASGNVYAARPSAPDVVKLSPTGNGLIILPSFYLKTDGTNTLLVPNDVVVDAAGNAYVTDSLNRGLLKVPPGGLVTDFAGGSISVGWADGVGRAATFDYPVNVAIDGSGNVYVTDIGNRTVRRITPAGAVTTLAGLKDAPTGSAISTALASPGSSAAGSTLLLGEPQGISVTSSGTLYFIDGHVVYKGVPASASTGGGTTPTTPITPTIPTTPGGSSGGGGGAPSAWFLGALAVLAGGRLRSRRRALPDRR